MRRWQRQRCIHQGIDCTDFPLDEITLYLTNDVLNQQRHPLAKRVLTSASPRAGIPDWVLGKANPNWCLWVQIPKREPCYQLVMPRMVPPQEKTQHILCKAIHSLLTLVGKRGGCSTDCVVCPLRLWHSNCINVPGWNIFQYPSNTAGRSSA